MIRWLVRRMMMISCSGRRFHPGSRGLFIIMLMMAWFCGCKDASQWEGQEQVKRVSTQTVPIQLQYRGTFDLGKGLFVSNEFEGARLNGAARTNDTLITLLITPENTPVNNSPWYAFKIWSEKACGLYVHITYPEGVTHRYFPKMSRDGLNWTPLDSSRCFSTMKTTEKGEVVPVDLTFQLTIDRDTSWISAQELLTSLQLERWIRHLETRPYVSDTIIGKSHEGRAIQLLKIGTGDDQKMIMIFSRQHPPEVTGYLAMQTFVETISADSELAKNFRNEFTAYVVPVINPDGVYHGHWRHNGGGVDLNRDWANLNQPETRAIRDFMSQKTVATGGKFYFGIDFHSTQEDIYYTIPPEMEGNMPGLVPAMIRATTGELDGYEPNIKPNSPDEPRITSTSYFFFEYGAEAVTYEVGDNTSRVFIRRKAEVSAIKLMELMLQRTSRHQTDIK